VVPLDIRSSAVVAGTPEVGPNVYLAQGAVVRAHGPGAVVLHTGVSVLENSVLVGTAELPLRVGRKTFFGHRCLALGAQLGDLCEVGNAAILLPGARVGSRCFLGEGALVPPGTVIPDGSVAVGRPARVIRRATEADMDRLRALREGNLDLGPSPTSLLSATALAGVKMGTLYAYRGKAPTVHPTAVLFDSCEVTGDVVVGEGCILGAGVRVVGDSHGPVRLGARVQVLENAVLHLLPDNTLLLEDDVVVGPGATVHGCHVGAGTVIEPGAILCDGARLGRGCLVRAGAVVKQRDAHPDGSILEGSPARRVGTLPPGGPGLPPWALSLDALATLTRVER
jgi:carbonic anhydrase/acetyltransferase-like protein (isoleucine patch superfamily)